MRVHLIPGFCYVQTGSCLNNNLTIRCGHTGHTSHYWKYDIEYYEEFNSEYNKYRETCFSRIYFIYQHKVTVDGSARVSYC
jgi:hypothetical protein